jgi:sec-independent protein translocase protein TatA
VSSGVPLIALVVPGLWQILLVLVLVLVLFGGKGKISSVMGDFAKGIQSFRKGLKEGGEEEARGGAAAIADANETVDVTPERKSEGSRSDG